MAKKKAKKDKEVIAEFPNLGKANQTPERAHEGEPAMRPPTPPTNDTSSDNVLPNDMPPNSSADRLSDIDEEPVRYNSEGRPIDDRPDPPLQESASLDTDTEKSQRPKKRRPSLTTPIKNPAKRPRVQTDKVSRVKDVTATPSPTGGRGRGRIQNSLIDDKKTVPGGGIFECYQNESKTAAYLGFEDIGDYRKVRFSGPVLTAYMNLASNNHIKKKDAKSALEILEVRIPTLSFGQTLADLDSATALALLLDRLLSDFEVMMQKNDAKSNQVAQAQAYAEFQKRICNDKNLTMPNINTETSLIPPPVWGPIEKFGEHPSERYARAYNLLFSLDHVMAPTRFRNIFEKAQSPFAKNPVNSTAFPTWMRANTTTVPKLLVRKAVQPFPTMILRPKLNSDIRSVLFERDDRMFNEQHESVPWAQYNYEPAAIVHNPFKYKGAYWRDLIRKDLGFPTYGLDFQKFEVTEKGESADSILISKTLLLQPPGESKITLWEEFKLWLDPTKCYEITFDVMTVEEEAEDYEFEYTGAPPALDEDLILDKEGDVTIRHADPEVARPGQGIYLSAEEQADIDELIAAGSNAQNLLGKAVSPTDGWTFPKDEKAFLEYYSGYDVRQPEKLWAWKKHALDTIIGPPERTEAEKPMGNHRVDKKTKAALKAQSAQVEEQILQRDEDNFQIEAAYLGTDINTGPSLAYTIDVLDMKEVGTLPDNTEFKTYSCNALKNCKATFLEPQMTGALWMLSRTFGLPPIHSSRFNSLSEEEGKILMNFQAITEAVDTGGGILSDGTGMGKTYTALLYHNYQAQHIEDFHIGMNNAGLVSHDGTAIPNYRYQHRPSVLITPSPTVLSQWASIIQTEFPDLELIIGFGDKAPKPAMNMNFVSAHAMRSYDAEKPETLAQWPKHLQFAWDTKDKRASATIILTTYETLAERVMYTVETPDPNDPDKKIVHYYNRWQGAVDTITLDEGHKARRPTTKIHGMIVGFHARTYWYITATITVNGIFDYLGPLKIFWNCIWRRRGKEKMIAKYCADPENDGVQGLHNAIKLPETDCRRVLLLDPKRIEKLLQSTDLAAVSKIWPHLDQLITLRRSASSTIGEPPNTLSLRGLMPKYTVKTQMIEYRESEKAEAQWLHRGHAREYVLAVKESMRSHGEESRVDSESKQFPHTTAFLRRLCICAASNLLGRFDLFLRRYGLNTLVADIDKFRQKGKNLDWFMKIVWHPNDGKHPDHMNHIEKLQYLCTGSPKARALCTQLRDYVLPDTFNGKCRKILFGEDTVPVGWLWELLFDSLYINTTVLHAQLSNQERIDIVSSFNDPENGLCCLISMFGVSTQGTNFHKACCRVVVITPAINAPTEMQFWGRVIRLYQKYQVEVIRLKTKNSNDQYRDSKQSDKMFMELVTRSCNDDIQDVLVKLLNDKNTEVVQAWDENDRRKKKGKKAPKSHAETLADALSAADTPAPADHADLADPDPAVKSRKSERKKIQRVRYDDVMLSSEVYTHDLPEEEDMQDSKGPQNAGSLDQYGEGEDEPFVVSDAYDDLEDIYVPSDEDDDDDLTDNAQTRLNFEEASSLDNPNVKKVRSALWQMKGTDIEKLNQDDFNLKALLRYDKDLVYTKEHLANPLVLDRALRLLMQARFGQESSYWRISPHINYDRLPIKASKAIEARMGIDKKDLRQLQKAKDTRSTK